MKVKVGVINVPIYCHFCNKEYPKGLVMYDTKRSVIEVVCPRCRRNKVSLIIENIIR